MEFTLNTQEKNLETKIEKILYIFIDESGNLDPKECKSQNEFNVLSAVITTEPKNIACAMSEIRYDLFSKEKFKGYLHHADLDNYTKKLFLEKAKKLKNYEIEHISCNNSEWKRKTWDPKERSNNKKEKIENRYKNICSTLIEGIIRRRMIKGLFYSTVIITLGNLSQAKNKKNLINSIKERIGYTINKWAFRTKFKFPEILPRKYILRFISDQCELLIQLADFFAWYEQLRLKKTKKDVKKPLLEEFESNFKNKIKHNFSEYDPAFNAPYWKKIYFKLRK